MWFIGKAKPRNTSLLSKIFFVISVLPPIYAALRYLFWSGKDNRPDKT